MDVLEFRESTNRCPIGWLGFFAMHPTVLPASSRLLGADIFGVASRKLEASLRQQRQSLAPTQCEIDDPLAGIVNTNEADMSPRWTSGSIEEAKLIGRQLATAFLDADRAAEKQSTPFDPKPSLAARYVEYPMQDNAYAGAAEKTCPRAALGVLSSAGASDHRTFLFNILGDQQPDPKHRDACHEFKALFPGPIKKLSGGPKAFTSTVSSSVVRIGDTAIGFVPAELTIAAGAQVKRALKEQLPGTHAIVGGLTNGYIQYVATEEEYQRQGYEGASTLFGPHSAALLSAVAGDLARNLSSPEGPLPGAADVATAAPYYLGPERARLPIGYDETPLSELQDRGARGLCSLTTPGLESVCFDFRDGAPGVAHSTYPRWIAVVDEQGRALLDDRGTAFRTVVHERAGDSWRWTTLVTPSREERAAIGTHRVRVVAGIDGQSPIYSAPFELVGLAQLPRCTPNEQVSCGL
jgi:neutral ceramidase